MTRTEWQKFLSVAPGDLSEDDKDALCKHLIDYEVESSVDIGHLRTLFLASKEVLKFKLEQVESLVLELDELATKQGEEEAQYTQQIRDLQDQLSFRRKPEGSQENGGSRDEDLQQELEQVELQVEKLLSELQVRDQEQQVDKQELERLAAQVTILENERSQLKREVAALREELRDNQSDKQQDETPSPPEEVKLKQQQLVESLRRKNKHISSLLNDLETVEKENTALQEKLSSIRSELIAATDNIKQTTGEIKSLQLAKEEQDDQMRQLEELCEALRNQVKELVNEKQERDKQLDSFERAVDLRLQECMQLVKDRDSVIQELQEKLSLQAVGGPSLLDSSTTSQIALLSQTLQKRELQIEDLQKQLSQATKDLNETSAVIENLRSRSVNISHNLDQTKVESLHKQLQQAEKRILFLEEKLLDAERDAENKAEDITEMIVKLRRYEAGEYGLAEAVAEIRELNVQQKVRDKHISELVDTVNQLKSSCDSLEEQNLALRDKLGLPPDEDVNVDGVTAKRRKDQLLMQVQLQHLERLEEELVQIKLEKRKLSQQVISMSKQLEDKGISSADAHVSSEGQVPKSAVMKKIRKLQHEKRQSQVERQALVEENESLRQGLHEILDSIHKQDGNSKVELQSKELEQLLQVLDCRHMSGWYHPAMRMQAQVNAIEGNNAALREQLRLSRQNEVDSSKELLQAKQRITELEGVLTTQSLHAPKTDEQRLDISAVKLPEEFSTDLSLPPDFPIGNISVQLVSKLNSHLLNVLNEYELEKGHVAQLQSLQCDLEKELESLLAQLACLHKEHSKSQMEWEDEKQIHQEQLEELGTKLAVAEARTTQLEKELSQLTSEDSSAYSSTQRMAALAGEKAVSDRQASAALRRAQWAMDRFTQVREELETLRGATAKRLEELLNFKRTSTHHISDLETKLQYMVPLNQLQAAEKRSLEMNAKYSELLQQHELIVSEMDLKAKELEEELKLEKEAKSKLIFAFNLREDTKNAMDVEQQSVSQTSLIYERERASHAEKMTSLVKDEFSEVQTRCSQLQQEVSLLLKSNHELQLKYAALEDRYLHSVPLENVRDLQDQLSVAQSQVAKLQASREQLQELADISREQRLSLDQLHEESETQLESLRQTVYHLQAKSDHAAIIARLNDDLCSSRISEMAAKKRASIIQTEILRLQSVCERQQNMLNELERKISEHKHISGQYTRQMMDTVSDLRARCIGTLPPLLFHCIVNALMRKSLECRNFWQQLQEAKRGSFTQSLAAEQDAVVRQQSLELQNVLQASHSDSHCQHLLESWAAKNRELHLKEIRSARRCEMLENQIRCMEERLVQQDELLSTLESQLLTLNLESKEKPFSEQDVLPDLQSVHRDTHQEEVTATEKPQDLQHQPTQCEKKDSGTQYVEMQLETPLLSVLDKNNDGAEELKDFKNQVSSLQGEVAIMRQQLISKDEELATCDNIITDLRQSVSEREKELQIKIQELKSTGNREECVVEGLESSDNLAYKATVDSLQNIINQKEETIGRYQSLLRDVREEDASIIVGLQEQVRSLQADLFAQEQAYNRLKSSVRQRSITAQGASVSRSALDTQLTRAHDLEDEVAILTTKLERVSSELQLARQEAQRWNFIAQQRSSALDDMGHRLHKQLLIQPEQSWNEAQDKEHISEQATSVQMTSKPNVPQKRSISELNLTKIVEGATRNRAQQVQLQLRAEVIELRKKLQLMEEQETSSKREIQRLRDQIPIYSRRRRPSNVDENSPKHADLNKKVLELKQQLQEQKAIAGKMETEFEEKLAKRIKSAENIARWDERKRQQSNLEKMKVRLQEKEDEISLLIRKSEKMHITIHRLSREKVVLEHQLKVSKESELPRCLLEELQQERECLRAKVRELEAVNRPDQSKLQQIEILKKENAALQKENVTLECESLQLKLELEKMQADTPLLQQKLLQLEKLVDELHAEHTGTWRNQEEVGAGDASLHLPRTEQRNMHAGNIHPVTLVNKMQKEIAILKKEKQELHGRCQDLAWQLDRANALITSLKSRLGNGGSGDAAVLQTELQHKSQLLSKVKILLERAALKERDLNNQVLQLKAALDSKSGKL